MSSPGRTAEDRAIKCAAGAFRTAAWILRLFWSTPDQRLHDLLNRMLDQISRAVPVPAVGDAIQHLQASASRFELSFDGQSDLEFQHSAETLEKDVERVLSLLNSRSGEQAGGRIPARTNSDSLHSLACDCVVDSFHMRTGRLTAAERRELQQSLSERLNDARSVSPDVTLFLKEPERLVDSFFAVWDLLALAKELNQVPIGSSGLPSARVHETLQALSVELHHLFDTLQPIREEIAADLRRRRLSMIQRMMSKSRAAAFVMFEDQLEPLREKHLPAVDELLHAVTANVTQRITVEQICSGVSEAFADQLTNLRVRLESRKVSWDKFAQILRDKSKETTHRAVSLDPARKIRKSFSRYQAARIQSLAIVFRALSYCCDDHNLLHSVLQDLSQASGCDGRFLFFDQVSQIPRNASGKYEQGYWIPAPAGDEIVPEDDFTGIYLQLPDANCLPVYGLKVPDSQLFGSAFFNIWFEIGRIERWSRLHADANARRETREFRISFWRDLPYLRKGELISSRSSRLFEPLRKLLFALSRNLRRPTDEHHHYLESFVGALERVGVTVTFPDLANCPSSAGVLVSEQFSPSPTWAYEAYSTTFSFKDSQSSVIETEVIRLVLVPREANEFAARLSDLNFRIPKVSSPEHRKAITDTVRWLFNHPVTNASEDLSRSAAIPALSLLNWLHLVRRTDTSSCGEVGPALQNLMNVFRELPQYQLVPPPEPGTVTRVFDEYTADIDWLAPVSTMNELCIDVNRFGVRNSHTVAPQRAQARLVLPTGSFPASAQEAVSSFLLRSTQVTAPEVQKLAVSLIGVLETQPVFRNVEQLLREWHQSHPDQLSDPVLPLLYAFNVTSPERLRQAQHDQCFASLRPQLDQLQERFRRSYLDGSVPSSMAGAGAELERLRTDLMNRANEILLPVCTVEDNGRCRLAERPRAEQIVECRFMANSEPHDAYIWQFGIPALQVADEYLVSAGPSPSVRREFQNFLAAAANAEVATSRSQQIEKNWAQYHLQISEPSEVFREWLCSECLQEICELVESAASRQLSTALWESVRSQYEGLIEQLSDYAVAAGMTLRLCHRWRELGPDWPDFVKLANGDLEWNKQDEFIMSRPIVENTSGKVLWRGQVKLLRR